MKVIVNAASAKMGGAVTYIVTVLRSLPQPESGYEFEVMLPPETAEKIEALPPNVRLIGTWASHAAWWKRLWWEQVTLRRAAVHHEDESLSAGAAGASRPGRAAAAGSDRRSGHHRSVSIPTPTPTTHPPAMSDG